MRKPRVLLAEDHTIVAEGLMSLLEHEVELIATVGDGRSMVDAARDLRPDVIIADVSMPALNGLDATRQLRRLKNPARIIFLTMHADVALAKEAFRAGASGYLLKQSAGKELLAAIEEVDKGGVYISPLITDEPAHFLLEATREQNGEDVTLTPRKREVFQLIAEGRTMKEIAATLKISSRTAESHKYELMEMFGVRTTAELIRHAIKIGLIKL